MGGASSINTVIYIRCNCIDFDGWDQPGWAFDDLLPYCKRSEDNERGESAYHGVGARSPVLIGDPWRLWWASNLAEVLPEEPETGEGVPDEHRNSGGGVIEE
jgi:choline dehydrogenase-like flavoprotein